MEVKKIASQIIEVAKSMNDIEYEENTGLEYLLIGEYFFEDDTYRMLKEEYENSCVYEHVTFEQYIKNSYCSW